MYHISNTIMKIIIVLSLFKGIRCSVDGKRIRNYTPYEAIQTETVSECNPLYWYPRHIPDHCNYKQQKILKILPLPVSNIPITAVADLHPYSFHLMMPQPILQWSNALRFGNPIVSTNLMLPTAGVLLSMHRSPPAPWPTHYSHHNNLRRSKIPHSYSEIMSRDGGINILPFTDAIADLWEKYSP